MVRVLGTYIHDLALEDSNTQKAETTGAVLRIETVFMCGEVSELFAASGCLTLGRLHSSLVCKKIEWDALVLEDGEDAISHAALNLCLIRN